MRKIIVEGKEYGWKMGKLNVLVRDSETNESFVIPGYEVAGINPMYWDTGSYPITPKMVAGSIRKHTRLRKALSS